MNHPDECLICLKPWYEHTVGEHLAHELEDRRLRRARSRSPFGSYKRPTG